MLTTRESTRTQHEVLFLARELSIYARRIRSQLRRADRESWHLAPMVHSGRLEEAILDSESTVDAIDSALRAHRAASKVQAQLSALRGKA